jgi:hypothetical protein
MSDDTLQVQIPLGIALSKKPTLGQLARRIAMCTGVAAAGQPAMDVLTDDAALLDFQIFEVNGELVAERSVPVSRKERDDLFRPRRRGRADSVLLRASHERDELQQELVSAAETGKAMLERVGTVMNTEPAERLSARFKELERELQAQTLPARQFIAAKQGAFELEVGESEPISFQPPTARTRAATTYAAHVTVAPQCPARRDRTFKVKAMVLTREPLAGCSAAEWPADLLKLEQACDFHFDKLDDWQIAVLAAAQALHLVIEIDAQPVVSAATLADKPAQVLVVKNWQPLLAALLDRLSLSQVGCAYGTT